MRLLLSSLAWVPTLLLLFAPACEQPARRSSPPRVLPHGAPHGLSPTALPATPSPSHTPGSQVQWLALSTTNSALDPRWGPALTEIMQRKPPRERGHWEDPPTLAHEMTHSIHFELRLANSHARRMNGFYVLGGRAAVVTEPRFTKATVASLVPPSLRRGRHDSYLIGQQGWDARPLYVWDEWTAYINGAVVAIERFQLGLAPHTTFATSDRVFAVLEFTVYAMAVVLAASYHDPSTLQFDTQFREFFAYNAERAMTTFERGRSLAPFQWPASDVVQRALRSSPDAESLRQCMRAVYGAPWTARVFGF